MTEIFSSTRTFKLWAYTVSHRRLLLRSPSEGGAASRIDVCFGGVDHMLVSPLYEGLTVVEVPAEEWGAHRDRVGEVPPGFKLYSLGASRNDFVTAGIIQYHEDMGDSRDPSYFGRFPGA
ncbi:hypothetical protein [Streptomyces sp. NPDC005408]|uniref:hypothetical protein n=1 Tax=Streptomyces sp. NPDC005408 TaxID=3155341 RepID=UPI0033AEC77E